MKTFEKYCEDLEQQSNIVDRAINAICYSTDLDSETVAQLSISKIIELLTTNGFEIPNDISPERFAAMVKLRTGLDNSREALNPH